MHVLVFFFYLLDKKSQKCHFKIFILRIKEESFTSTCSRFEHNSFFSLCPTFLFFVLSLKPKLCLSKMWIYMYNFHRYVNVWKRTIFAVKIAQMPRIITLTKQTCNFQHLCCEHIIRRSELIFYLIFLKFYPSREKKCHRHHV